MGYFLIVYRVNDFFNWKIIHISRRKHFLINHFLLSFNNLIESYQFKKKVNVKINNKRIDFNVKTLKKELRFV